MQQAAAETGALTLHTIGATRHWQWVTVQSDASRIISVHIYDSHGTVNEAIVAMDFEIIFGGCSID